MTTRCGYVAVVGAPNAGKSTLVNALVGQKVAIVTPKAQTTRARMLGIALHGDTQLVLVDTPGIFAPRRRLDRAMVAAAWEGASEADLVVLVVDAAKALRADVADLASQLGERKTPQWLALNKTDLAAKPTLLTLADQLNQRTGFERTFMISAATGDGVGELKAAMAARMPEGPWLFPADEVSDANDRRLAAELTREQLYRQLRAELPYDAAVATETFEERKDGSVMIRQQILVARDSQKAIVLGKGGTRIKALGEAARVEIAAALGRKVHLFLHVKVDPKWQEDRGLYREIGLDWTE
ncbi:MAG: GTPase Era [Sphingosinicella sp.]